jgi:hypothetical protein
MSIHLSPRLGLACLLCALVCALHAAEEGSKPLLATVSAVDVTARTITVTLPGEEEGSVTTQVLRLADDAMIKLGKDDVALVDLQIGATIRFKTVEVDGSVSVTKVNLIVPKEPKPAKEKKKKGEGEEQPGEDAPAEEPTDAPADAPADVPADAPVAE